MQTAILVSFVAIFFAFLSSYKVFKYGLEIAILIITAFVALRYGWGTDFINYHESFIQLSEFNLNMKDLRFASQLNTVKSSEWGWTVLNILCIPIGFFGLNILLAIVENLIIYDFIKRYVDKKYYWLAVFIYTMNPNLMVLGCSMMRQWLAMCIILFSIRFIISGKFKYYLLFVILAASFHNSAIITIFLYLFRRVNKKVFINNNILPIFAISIVWIIIGTVLPLGSFMTKVSDESYNLYINNNSGSSQGLGLGFGVLFTVFLYVYCITQRKFLPNSKNLLCLMLFTYIIILPFTNHVAMASRLYFYIDAIAIAAIPVAMKVSHQKGLSAVLVIMLMCWYLFLYNIFFNAPSNYLSYRTYQTILSSPYWQ